MDRSNSEEREKIRIIPPVYFFICLVAGLLLHWWYPLLILPMESPLRLGLALPLLFLSGMIAATARRTLTKNKAGFHPGDRSGNLVVTGIYRFSRHPMYLSLVILFVGVAFLINSIYLLVITPVLVVILHFGVILKEEKLLEHYFGDAYLQYKKRVRRWL